MNTLIESINKITKIKSELNQILQENGIDGGDVFSEYPDKFRELFRIVDVYTDSTYDGYDEVAVNVVTVVPQPRMSVYQNIVTITCDLDEANIYYWIKTDSGNNEVGLTVLKKGSTVVMSESGTVFCYAKFREETSNTVSIYCQVEQIIVPDPPRITRDGTTVTIEKFGDDDIIYYSTGGDYELYTEPITVYRYEDVYAFTQNYRGRSDIIIDEAPEQPVLPDVPVMSYTPNTLTITCTTVGADIYYKKTTDQYWTKYTSPITLTQSGIYITKSLKDGLQSEESDGLFCQFIETPADPVFNVVDNKVYIVCATGADIYYKIGSGEYQLYTSPITLTETVVISAYADNQGIESDTVTQTCTYVEPVVPTPPADPVISCSNNIVTITCSTSGATIYYRTDSGNWLTYTGPIEITETLTFSSYSSKNELNSNVVSQECEYVAPVTPEIPEVPVFSCSNNIVSITCSTINASIYYRDVNDSTWTLYNGPFSISQTTQFVAYSYKNGQNSSQSSVFTATYIPDVVIPDVPVISCIDNLVSITCATSGATIYYKINDGSFTTYVNSIEINSDITVYAYAELDGVTSNTVSEYCEYQNNVPIDEYDPEPTNSYYSIPLTISMIESGSLLYTATTPNVSTGGFEFDYSFDNVNWTTVNESDMTYTFEHRIRKYTYLINLNANSIIRLRCTPSLVDGGFLGTSNNDKTVTFKITGQCNVYGNLLSLVFSDGDYEERSYHISNNMMSALFKESDIVDASNLIIPKYPFCDYCYTEMFSGCTDLVLPPMIKHINTTTEHSGTGYKYVFCNMFKGCTSLSANSKLPSFKNSRWDYAVSGMFQNCTSLKSKVILDIGTDYNIMKNFSLGSGMFSGCTDLSVITINCSLSQSQRNYINNYLEWLFSGLSGSGTLYCTDSQTTAVLNTSTISLPQDWTVQSI